MNCYFCKKKLELPDQVGRRDDCSYCGADLHICYNCKFYDKASYNECKEPQAERVVDKEKSNFCDYFSPQSFSDQDSSGLNAADEAKKKLEALFKK